MSVLYTAGIVGSALYVVGFDVATTFPADFLTKTGSFITLSFSVESSSTSCQAITGDPGMGIPVDGYAVAQDGKKAGPEGCVDILKI
jgi:hypothetical protein